jgi:hypothetical protein
MAEMDCDAALVQMRSEIRTVIKGPCSLFTVSRKWLREEMKSGHGSPAVGSIHHFVTEHTLLETTEILVQTRLLGHIINSSLA